jgi:sigma-E factor negative regulatory protein RseC
VVLKASMGMKAVWIAYFLPLVVLLAVALGLIALGVGEAVAGLAGIAAVGVYYFGVWLFRDRLRNEYVFTIQQK